MSAERPLSKCSSCQADIFWVISTNSKRMPLDAVPVADGKFVLDEYGDPPMAFIAAPEAEMPRYHTHFVTCPNASSHRR